VFLSLRTLTSISRRARPQGRPRPGKRIAPIGRTPLLSIPLLPHNKPTFPSICHTVKQTIWLHTYLLGGRFTRELGLSISPPAMPSAPGGTSLSHHKHRRPEILSQSIRISAFLKTPALLLLFMLVPLAALPPTPAFVPTLIMESIQQRHNQQPGEQARKAPCDVITSNSLCILHSISGTKQTRATRESSHHEDAPGSLRRLTWGAPSVTHSHHEASEDGSVPSASFISTSSRVNSPSAVSASTTTADVMSLDSIRSTLIRQEDSIIFALIERAQFRQNQAIYAKGILQLDPSIPDYPFLKTLSFLEYLLLETEKLHGKVRRYTSPEEHAFFPEHLPDPILTPLQFPALLAPNTVDVNAQVLHLYINEVVPAVCKEGDDEQHGSSVLADITLLQALSRRIHLGKFVAETKFQEEEAKYRALVGADDVDGVMSLLTNSAVEARVLARAKLKASTYGQDIMGETEACKVEPDVIAAIYRDVIIPLTKDVEVLYLFERVGRKPPAPLPGPASHYRLRVGEKGGERR